jgi:hypothetical protein
MIFQVIWKVSLHFGHYVIYKGENRVMHQCYTGLVSDAAFSRWTWHQNVALVLWQSLFSALLNKQSNCSLLRFVFSNWINVLASSKAEVSYVFHRNDVGRLQTATLDILLLPNTGLDSKDIVGKVTELCALCTWTI